jgi:squalene-hopene/tetraprenyl-beta-curcumene cyclase
MSLAGMGDVEGAQPVAAAGVRFLLESMRPDGSWPIDTNLSTWVTTLSIDALGNADALPPDAVDGMRSWLLAQQSTREHPFTHAAAGAWAWTPLSGGVPDADDTSGALVALAHLGVADERARAAAARGVRWLIDLQNRNGGIPTFCRGWGTLPFDRSTPEITAHALQAWSAWAPHLEADLRVAAGRAAARAVAFIAASQRRDGSWIPLWFGNEHAPDHHNPVYGTARVLLGLQAALVSENGTAARCRRGAIEYLCAAQSQDGGWGGAHGAPSTLEETGMVVAALSVVARDDPRVSNAAARGAAWLSTAAAGNLEAAPIGLYFAQLWYYEELYPLVFALEGLGAFDKSQSPQPKFQRDPKSQIPDPRTQRGGHFAVSVTDPTRRSHARCSDPLPPPSSLIE